MSEYGATTHARGLSGAALKWRRPALFGPAIPSRVLVGGLLPQRRPEAPRAAPQELPHSFEDE